MNKKMFKEIKKGSKIKIISGKYKGLVDSVFFFNRKKYIIYLNSLIRNLPLKFNNDKAEKKTKKVYIPIDFSNISLQD